MKQTSAAMTRRQPAEQRLEKEMAFLLEQLMQEGFTRA
jgi:hypothetical protein